MSTEENVKVTLQIDAHCLQVEQAEVRQSDRYARVNR